MFCFSKKLEGMKNLLLGENSTAYREEATGYKEHSTAYNIVSTCSKYDIVVILSASFYCFDKQPMHRTGVGMLDAKFAVVFGFA